MKSGGITVDNATRWSLGELYRTGWLRRMGWTRLGWSVPSSRRLEGDVPQPRRGRGTRCWSLVRYTLCSVRYHVDHYLTGVALTGIW